MRDDGCCGGSPKNPKTCEDQMHSQGEIAGNRTMRANLISTE
jgi:hypothetical protein